MSEIISCRGICTEMYLVAVGSIEATRVATEGLFVIPGAGCVTSQPVWRVGDDGSRGSHINGGHDAPINIALCIETATLEFLGRA